MKSLITFGVLLALTSRVLAEEAASPDLKETQAHQEAPADLKETPKTEPKADLKPEAKPEAKSETKPAQNSVSLVMPLEELLGFHDAEKASLKKLMDRWNEKLGSTMKRRQEMESDIASMQQKIAELTKESSKKSKNEAARLSKAIDRSNKDIKGIDSQLKAQSKELAGELKEISREAQTALKDAYQQAITHIQTPATPK